MINLTELPERYLATLGRPRLAEICGQTEGIVAMWLKRKKFPLEAVQRLLEHDPSPLAEIKPLYETFPLGGKLAVLMPLSGPPNPNVLDCLIRLYDRREMQYQRVAFNCLSVSRNALAAWGLRTPCEWFFWLDGGDTIVPCGDVAWFKQAADVPQMPDIFAGFNTIYRLLAHYVKLGRKDATMVSVSYVARREGGELQFGGGEKMRQLVKQGPRDQLIEVPWVGFGGVLTHRSVFEDIIKTQGDSIRLKQGGVGSRFGYEYGFFSPIDQNYPSDDLPFCIRAQRAGHKIHVDLAVQAAHFGDRAFTFADL